MNINISILILILILNCILYIRSINIKLLTYDYENSVISLSPVNAPTLLDPTIGAYLMASSLE